MKAKDEKPPANWPFPTYKGKPIPAARQPKTKPPAAPDALF